MADIKPEAVGFTARNGKGGGTLVVEVAEPFFLHFNADVRFHPFVTPDDPGEDLGRKYS
jgi:hypothetical protein